MSIEDLTKKVKEAAERRTPEERAELLRKAHILDENGEFCEEYFPLHNLYLRSLREN